MKAARLFIILILVSSVVFLRWWFFYDQSLTGIDDANIYFVYAKNLAEGNGFVYNVGGERVEGFTSFLWVLILALFYLLGPMEILALALNLLLVTFTLYKLTSFADTLSSSSPSKDVMGPAAWVVLAFTCLIPGYLDWTVLSLMETGLWSFLLILISLSLLQLFLEPENKSARRQLLFLLPLLVLTRPESLAWGLLFIAIRMSQFLYFGQSVSAAIRSSTFLFSAYLVPLVLLLVFRLIYFGYPLPNTFYAKVSPDIGGNLLDGAYYLLRYIKENPFIPVFIFLYFLSLIFIIRSLIQTKRSLVPTEMIQITLLLIMSIHFLIPFYTGGDHFYLSRFFQPLYPLFLIAAFNKQFWLRHSEVNLKLSPRITAYLTIALCLLILASTRFSLFSPSPILKEFEIARYGRETGEQLNELFEGGKEYPSVGTYLAGGLAYKYKGKTIDVLGLNNTLIAHAPKEYEGGYKNHNAFSKAAFYKILPEVVHIDFIENLNELTLNETDSADFQNQVYKYIFLEEKFRSTYVPVLISCPKDNWYLAYVQEDYLNALKERKRKFYIISRKNSTDPEQEEYQLQLSLYSF